MQSTARVVIIGGGVMGIGLLHSLALEGWTDTILVEKGELTSGSTWHAAGQCPSFIANYNLAKVHAYSNDLYARLEAETGVATGWHATGGIRFATNQLELDHFKRVEGVAANIGFRMQIISPEEIRRINPFVTTEGVLAGAWTLDDGYVDPSSSCNAMATAAKQLGGTIVRHNRVLGIEQLPSGDFRVSTEQGDITCEHVVNAAGCYADRVSAWLGVQTRFANMKHQYVVTGPVKEFEGRDVEMPVMRDPHCSSYYRQEQTSGLIGIYENSDTEEAWKEQGGPAWDSENELFPAQLDRLMPFLERVMERMPIFADAGIKKVVNGAISHTPDSNPLVGPAPGVRNFWLATGTGIGIAQGPGCGKYLAQWMVHGDAEINMQGMDPRRYGDFADQAYVSAKAHREYWDMYRLIPPGEERPEGRPAKTTPLYDTLLAKGCVFTEGFGWERPKWFSADGAEEDGTFRRTNAHRVVATECRAVREGVGIMELPGFTKLEVSGADAETFLESRLRQPDAEAGRRDRPRPCPVRPGPVHHRVHDHASGSGPLPAPLGRGGLPSRPGPARLGRPRRRGSHHRQRHARLDDADRGRAAHPRGAGRAHVGGPVVRGIPVADRAGDHGRRARGARAARQLRRRAGLGAPLPHGGRGCRLRGRLEGRRAVRDRRFRPVRDEQPAAGEVLRGPGLRAHQRDHAGRGQHAALRQAGPRVPRQGGRRGGARAGRRPPTSSPSRWRRWTSTSRAANPCSPAIAWWA